MPTKRGLFHRVISSLYYPSQREKYYQHIVIVDIALRALIIDGSGHFVHRVSVDGTRTIGEYLIVGYYIPTGMIDDMNSNKYSSTIAEQDDLLWCHQCTYLG